MANQIINNGTTAGDGTGENLFSAWTKANANFAELYNGLGGVIAKSGAAVSHTGDLTETVLATIAIPANALGANGVLRVTSIWGLTSSANVKSIRARIGGSGVSGSVIMAQTALTAVANVRVDTLLINANSTSAQVVENTFPRGTDLLVTDNYTTSAVDMTAAQNLVFSGQLANTGETITLLGYIVEAMK